MNTDGMEVELGQVACERGGRFDEVLREGRGEGGEEVHGVSSEKFELGVGGSAAEDGDDEFSFKVGVFFGMEVF